MYKFEVMFALQTVVYPTLPRFQVSSSAVLGPNVTIGANTVVKDGVRIKHAILLAGCQVGYQTLIDIFVSGTLAALHYSETRN